MKHNMPVRYTIDTRNIPNLCESFSIERSFEGSINISKYSTHKNFKFYINILDRVFDYRNYIVAIKIEVLIKPDIIIVGWITPALWYGILIEDNNFNLFDGRFNVAHQDAIYLGDLI